MIARVVHGPRPLLVGGLCCLFLVACAGDAGLKDAQRDSDIGTGGLSQRAVIGGMDHLVAGGVITRYMDEQARELQSLAATLRVRDGIIVSLPEKPLFKFNKADLVPKSRRMLRNIADVLARYAKTRLTVVGHTDNRGFAEFDIRLSERRAKAVADDLIDSGVARQRIRIMGMGFERPVAGNDTVEGRARNRRVEIHIAPDEQLREEDRVSLP